jgi:hypothetical protein
MKRIKILIASAVAITVAAVVLMMERPALAQEDPSSANYMLPLCRTWLRMMSHDLAAIKDELTTGNAGPGGIPAYMLKAGMCAGVVIGISDMLNGSDQEPRACIPMAVTNEQLVRVVIASIEKNPAHMHENFTVDAAAALVVAWPCHK